MKIPGKDLTQEAPLSPRTRINDFVILGRLADKARAEFLGGNVGEYHTACPLDMMLLDWKGIPYDDVKNEILAGADDQKLGLFVAEHGKSKTPAEVRAWSDEMEQMNPYHNPEKRDWYVGQLQKLGLDPATTPLFAWLDADDKHSFPR